MAFRVETQHLYGNACAIAVAEAEGASTIHFTADPHGGPERLWFCLRIVADGPSRSPATKLNLALENIHDLLGGNQPEHMRPVWRRAGGDWERLAPPRVEQLPDGRRCAIWVVPAPETWVEVAFCYPYGPAELETLLRDTGAAWKSDAIGVSQGGRELVRVSNRYGQVGGADPGVYLIARQHSGETPGSWVMDGMLRQFAAAGAGAPLVWAVPFSNVDGVMQGDYGKDNFPYDLNRAWGRPPMRHETLAIQGDLRRWLARCRPVLALDLHAPGGSEADGIYAYLPNPRQAPAIHRRAVLWAGQLEKALGPEFAAEKFARVADYPSRWETAHFGDFCFHDLGCDALSIETPYGLIKGVVLTRERYLEAGRRMAAGVLKAIGR